MAPTAALSAAAVADIATDPGEVVAFTAVLALVTGLFALLAGLLRLGFIAKDVHFTGRVKWFRSTSARTPRMHTISSRRTSGIGSPWPVNRGQVRIVSTTPARTSGTETRISPM